MNLKNVLYRILKPVYTIFRKNKNTYHIGNFELNIPDNFALPHFQKTYKLYDRFLPVLATHIDSGKIIIDVGANIGDTAYALLQNCQNPIICIEPSDIFFLYLKRNIEKLPESYFKRVTLLKQLAGTGNYQGELSHTISGTAGLKKNSGTSTLSIVPLDTVLEKNIGDVILLKIDTDGFDFDVLLSSLRILSTSRPILFWENDLSEDFQRKGYEEVYTKLSELGYEYFFIFDNFGNLLIEEASNPKTLNDINTYLTSQNKHQCTRTFYYTDILATTRENITQVRKAIDVYKKNWIHADL